VIADGGAGNDIGLLAKIADSEKKTGLSFHVYCASTLFGSTTPPEVTANDPVCPRNADLAFIQQEIASARNDSTRVLTEFGATDSIPYVSLVAGLADQHMVSWHYWQYAGWSDPTGNPSEEGLFTNDLDRPGSLKQAKADVLIRTYPQAVAGTPTSFSFDPVSKEFTLTYSADPAITAPTEIFVPVARHYDGHYCVVVDGPVTVDSSPDASPLKLAGTGTAGTVHVLVTKRITTCP
jgi:endoglycosylceramidase